ncbi:MAG: hypothetical protein SF162_05995 [bacterium]|nr:hypothetical protein [bacterium]
MEYNIHLYVPKTGRLTPLMIEWLYQHGTNPQSLEAHYPVRKLEQRALARVLLQFDPTLVARPGVGGDVELCYPNETLNLRLYCHSRGCIVVFPYMGGALARITLGIAYTYIRFLYEGAGFWSYDPQLNLISYADDFQSIDDTAALMESLLPRLLNG